MGKLLSIIYPYRNREVIRVKNALDSLLMQSNPEFEVKFVDYGSSSEYQEEIKDLCKQYSFVDYTYCHTQFQPWNKSRTLNSVIKGLETDFCFVADVDMVFHPDFVKRAIGLQQKDTTIYFQVGFLGSNEKVGSIDFANKNIRKSTFEATGLSMFSVKTLKELQGFDEFYHFWGAEDTDMHVRLQNAGYPVEFYDREVLMLHQWHPSYRSSEKNTLTTNPQVAGIVQLNHEHLKFAISNKVTKVNPEQWGEIPRIEEIRELEQSPDKLNLTNRKSEINDLLFGQLPIQRNKIFKFQVRKDPFQASVKYWVKKSLRKKVPEYYSLKEINDLLLLHIISSYRDNPYTYKISHDLDEIEVAIKFN